MTIFFGDINVWAVLGVAVLSMVFGMTWHSRAVFGKQWGALIVMPPERMDGAKKKAFWKTHISAFVGALVSAYVMSYFIIARDAITFAGGAWVGFLIWLGFVAPVMMGSVLWEGRSIQLYYLNAGHYLIWYALMGGLLALWL